jgi:hypothetical protein
MAQRRAPIDPKGASRPAWETLALIGGRRYATRLKKLKEVRKAMDPEAAAAAPAGV